MFLLVWDYTHFFGFMSFTECMSHMRYSQLRPIRCGKYCHYKWLMFRCWEHCHSSLNKKVIPHDKRTGQPIMNRNHLECNVTKTLEEFLPAAKHAGLWIIIGPIVRPSQSSQGSLYRPEKHGNMGYWGHWVQFWGQPWPPRSFGGRHGLRGHQNGCWNVIWAWIPG